MQYVDRGVHLDFVMVVVVDRCPTMDLVGFLQRMGNQRNETHVADVVRAKMLLHQNT